MARGIHKYSIILPVRNGGDYVKQCVNSILSQSLPHFNLHILDNNSNDGTLEWIRTLKDERIIIYSSDVSLSMEENWGRIISIPKNEFMTMIGHDDVLDENYLSVMDKLIHKHPAASLYQTHFRYIDSRGSVLRQCRPMAEVQYVSEFMESILDDSLDTMGSGYMMKTSDYNRLGGIRPYPNLLFADHELWIRLSAIGYKATSPESCFSFRVHESVSRKSVAARYVRAFFMFMDFLAGIGLTDPKISQVIKTGAPKYISYYCRSLSHRLLKTPKYEREGMTVDSVITNCKQWADRLAPGNHFDPFDQFSVWLAKIIDNNIVFRKLYLAFKKVHKKPIYS